MHHIHCTFQRRVGQLRRPSVGRQAGVVLIIALIALAILMIGGVALVRSFDTSMLMAGNLAFKRDLMNQAERAMAQAITTLSTGALANEAARQADLGSSNYSATSLASDAHGLPVVLLANDATFTATYTAGDISDTASKVVIRYVIDRQCSVAGAYSPDNCTSTGLVKDEGGTARLVPKKPGGAQQPIYRISVRVTGPRNTQAYLQTTVTL